MTTELLQNLIPNSTKSVQHSKSQIQNVDEKSVDGFSKLFDNAKLKYVSTSETFENHSINNKKHLVEKKEAGANDNQRNASSKIKTSIEEKKSTNEEAKGATILEQNSPKLTENILNNILLGKSTTKNTEEENDSEFNSSTVETQNTEILSNLEDVLIEVVTEVETQTKQDTDLAIVEENINMIDIESDETIQNQQNVKYSYDSNFIDRNALAVKASDTLDTLKQYEGEKSIQLETISSAEKVDENNLELLQEIENLDGESLVKVEDVIDLAVDEISTESTKNIDNNSKISQEIIDELDVTVNSMRSTDKQKMMGEQGQSFSQFNGNTQGNAQENIIKMSLENAETNSEFSVEGQNTNLQPNVNSTDGTDILLNKVIESSIKPQGTNNSTPSAQMLSDTEILSQINNKLTLPQDNVTNKVNIILQPEQLGKVSVEIMQTKDGIVAKMVADTVQVKDILDKSIESLKNTLSSQGVNVNNITVKVEESSAAQNSNFGFEQEQFNRESANQSNHSNQQRHSNAAMEKTEQSDNLSSVSQAPNESEIVEHIEPETKSFNENGSISIMV